MLANILISHETVKFCGKCDTLQRAHAWEIDGSGLWCLCYYLLAVWPYELIKLSEPLFLHQLKKKKAERYLAELQSGLNEIKLINLAIAKWKLLKRGTEEKRKKGRRKETSKH